MGIFWMAVIGAVATLVVLVALRLLYAVLPRSSGLHLSIEVDPAFGLDADALRALLQAHRLPDQPLSQSFDRSTGLVGFTTPTHSRSLPECDRLAEALRANPAVLRFTMLLVEDAGARDTAG